MKPLGRRSFFGLVASLPVVLKDASTKMGLEGVIAGSTRSFGASRLPTPPADDGSWIRRTLSRFWSASAVRERRQQAEWEARHLDSDLASMRSLSPAAAYRLQCDRQFRRIEVRSRMHLQEMLEEQTTRSLDFSS